MPLTRLILIRHGQAEANAASRRDIDRALTDQGREDAGDIGRRLAQAGYAPDRALVSTAVRAAQTWEAAAPAFGAVEAEPVSGLYDAGPAALLAAAREAGVSAVAVVAHNPGLHTLAMDLATRGQIDPQILRRLREGFPPGSAAVFRFEEGRPTCEALFTP